MAWPSYKAFSSETDLTNGFKNTAQNNHKVFYKHNLTINGGQLNIFFF